MTYFNLFSKTLLSFCLLLAFYSTSVAQSVTYKQLSKEEVNKVFTTTTKTLLDIDYPIYRVYTYWDMEGESYLVLTENPTKTLLGKDATDKIKAVYIRNEDGILVQMSEMSDVLHEDDLETSIWFWTKYIAFDDYDKDGIIDPIVVYGSVGINDFDDGRVYITVNYKGEQIKISHQNSIFDDERNTKVDEAFYILPNKIQNKVKEIMSTMEGDKHAIFPAGWIEAMGNKKTYFDEN